jgi:hypothetical protein
VDETAETNVPLSKWVIVRQSRGELPKRRKFRHRLDYVAFAWYVHCGEHGADG